jgi:serine/threonine-protein phosphatase PGAM5
MARARETTQIIEEHLPDWIVRMDPDPNLNKGLPCHSIPVALIEKGHERMEEAFDSYFYRADEPVEQLGVVSDDITSSSGDNIMMAMEDPQHEIEIIVCHGDVIRYFFFRALQLHPQAWRPSYCSLTHLTVQPTGTVR